MPTYKGNAGHLMQHWTLCELLHIAHNQGVQGLSFIDAHAMAPLAITREDNNDRFDHVRDGLPGRRSVYERAWHHQAPKAGYPNSAAFVDQVWQGDFSLLLCETDQATIAELDPWLEVVDRSNRCMNAELYPGNWRDKFRLPEGLPNPTDLGLSDGSLTLVSFDPYMYNRNHQYAVMADPEEGNLYPDDVRLARNVLHQLTGGIVIQLSTYSAMDNNRQPAVTFSLDQILLLNNFDRHEPVVLDGNMMSLVYTRNVPWANELVDLPVRFNEWRPNR